MLNEASRCIAGHFTEDWGPGSLLCSPTLRSLRPYHQIAMSVRPTLGRQGRGLINETSRGPAPMRRSRLYKPVKTLTTARDSPVTKPGSGRNWTGPGKGTPPSSLGVRPSSRRVWWWRCGWERIGGEKGEGASANACVSLGLCVEGEKRCHWEAWEEGEGVKWKEQQQKWNREFPHAQDCRTRNKV